jgi:sporulation protein YlmC with PRC-barrel domain
MRNKNTIIALVAGALALATTNLTAQGADEMLPPTGHPRSAPSDPHVKGAPRAQNSVGTEDFKATSIVGMSVFDDAGERLGKVQDLIVSLASGSVPFAVIEYGGTLGFGQTRVAVPLKDLKWSSEPKQLILATTKAQFESASSAPTGGWTAVADEKWTRDIDRFYGQPATGSSRFERQESGGMAESREAVRSPADQRGATHLLNQPGVPDLGGGKMTEKPSEEDLSAKINSVLQQNLGEGASGIQATITNGIVTLSGSVANQAQKARLENQIKATPGVKQVQDQLVTKAE